MNARDKNHIRVISPSVAVCGVDVHAEIQQELDYVVMPRTHCIVQGCDALVIGSARVLHLENNTAEEGSR